MSIPETYEDYPRVPIRVFKTNPARFEKSGALVTNHGHVRAVFVPVDEEDPRSDVHLDAAKTRLRMLARMRDPDDVARELAELTTTRDQDLVGEPR